MLRCCEAYVQRMIEPVAHAYNVPLLRSAADSMLHRCLKPPDTLLGTWRFKRLAGSLTAHSDTSSAVQLRGALRGCTAPVQVSALRKSLEIGGTAGPASQVITPIIDELAAEGSVQGRLQGGGSSWIPAAHSRRQQEAVTSFYHQNGFVGCAPGHPFCGPVLPTLDVRHRHTCCHA